MKLLQKSILAIATFCAVSTLSAQQTTGDITKQADAVPGTTTTGGAIRLIDNRGTIKYLQVQNGLTILSNTTNDVTTTTWQLGGTLEDDTTITLNDGTDDNAFVIDGVNYSLENIAQTTAAAATATSATSGTETGYTLLVRNEDTGNVEKLIATDLIQSGQQSFTATAGQTTFTLTAMGTALPTFQTVYVFRNGAKLIAGVDYTIVAGGADVELVPGGTAPNDWQVYAGDVIEVQFIK